MDHEDFFRGNEDSDIFDQAKKELNVAKESFDELQEVSGFFTR